MYLDCGCCILDNGKRAWCPTCIEDAGISNQKKSAEDEQMKMSPFQLAGEAIDLFIEYRDCHGFDEKTAKDKALYEIFEYIHLTKKDQ